MRMPLVPNFLAVIAGVLLALSACSTGYSDPYDARAYANAQIEKTQAARSSLELQTTLDAAKTLGAVEAELQLLEAQSRATQQAFDIAARQAAATEQAFATQAMATAQAQQTATTWPLTATPQAATQAAIVRDVERAERRAYWMSMVDPVSVVMPILLCWVALVLLLVGAIAAYRRLMPVIELRARAFQRGPYDAPLIILPNLVIDPDRNFGPALQYGPNGVTSTGHAPSPELQAGVTTRDQAIDLVRGMNRTGQDRKMAQRYFDDGQSLPAQTNTVAPVIHLPHTAPWRMLDDWRGGSLPLGLGERGLILANPETSSHLLMAGTSGSGKTRYGLRPLAASALADGWQASIFDRSGLDFLPFQNHPNARLVLLDDPTRAIAYLQALYREIQRRFALLREEGASTWGRLSYRAGPRVLAVFDEFSNLADSLDHDGRDELWRGARMVAAEGRKAGVHLALALQDPTHKALDLRIRRNCTPISFRVKDGDASRVILGACGAENLPERQFMTVMGSLVRGVGFVPDDEEIYQFLGARPVPKFPAPEWLEDPQEATQEKTSGNNSIQELAQRIRPSWERGESKRAMARSVGKEYAGAFVAKLDAAISLLEGATTTS